MDKFIWRVAGPRRPSLDAWRVLSLVFAALLAAIEGGMGLAADPPRVQLKNTSMGVRTIFVGALSKVELLTEVRARFDFAFALAPLSLALALALVL